MPSSQKMPLLAYSLLFLANLFFAINFTVAKEVMPTYLSPFLFILFRVLGASLLFTTYHLLFIKEKVASKDFKLLFLCSLFGVSLNQLLFFQGLDWTTPINGALIMTLTPISVALMSFLILKEKLTLRKIIGIILGLVGALILISYGKVVESHFKGDLLILINAFAYAIYLVMVRPLMKIYHPITILRWIFTFGLVVVIPVVLYEQPSFFYTEIPSRIWWIIAYVIVFVTFLAYLFNAWALQQVSSSVVSMYIYLQPVLATLIAVLFYHQHLNWIQAVASIFVFIGVFLVTFQSERKNETVK
jgi:drug/metabolite transporter (DMT)-like permease